MTSKQHSVVVASVLAAVISAAGTNARAQCPTTLPQSVINSIQLPEARAAAQSTRLDAAMIAQNGGLSNMVRLAKAQLEADRATVAEERRNQTYLTQNGMGNDKRALDGRMVIQMLEDSQRATSAFIEIMECNNRMNGVPGGQTGSARPGANEDRIVPGAIPAAAEMLPGPARTPSSIVPGSRPAGAPAAPSSQNGFGSGGSVSPSTTNAWAMSPGDRQAALSHEVRRFRPGPQGADAKTALDSLSRSMREKAMAKASPEVAAFWAKQDALRANGDANTAAAMAGQARGLADAKNGSLDAQMKMVNDAVKGWQVPRGYSATAINAGAIVDPFAASAPIDFKKAVELALGSTGLAWNRTRQIAQMGTAQGGACGGRLQVGDYPVLPDGNLLDTPERIAQFLETCAASSPVLVVRESGEVEVRK